MTASSSVRSVASVKSVSTASTLSIKSASSPCTYKTTVHISNVRGRVWDLSQDAQGSRSVQGVLQDIGSNDLEQLALELQGHFLEAAKCPHANFVLQKFICQKTPKASRVIALELMSQGVEAVVQAARHRYGCRIVQRLLEFCDKAEADELTNMILLEGHDLCAHPYGNYTVQHILVHGSHHHRQRLVKLLREHVAEMAANFHAAAVIGEALRHADYCDTIELARALVQDPGLLSQMARTKHGHLAGQRAMQLLKLQDMEQISANL